TPASCARRRHGPFSYWICCALRLPINEEEDHDQSRPRPACHACPAPVAAVRLRLARCSFAVGGTPPWRGPAAAEPPLRCSPAAAGPPLRCSAREQLRANLG